MYDLKESVYQANSWNLKIKQEMNKLSWLCLVYDQEMGFRPKQLKMSPSPLITIKQVSGQLRIKESWFKQKSSVLMQGTVNSELKTSAIEMPNCGV